MMMMKRTLKALWTPRQVYQGKDHVKKAVANYEEFEMCLHAWAIKHKHCAACNPTCTR